MTDVVLDLVRKRLTLSGLGPRVRDVVLAAFGDENHLETVVRSGATPEAGTAVLDEHHGDDVRDVAVANGVWLTGVRAEGFRGVATSVEVGLAPGPGLVLVTGRNGSGKSSLAEAAELALSRTSERARTRLWAKGLINLHHAGSSSVEVSVHLDGGEDVSVGLRLTTDGLEGATTWATRGGAPFDLAELAWDQMVSRYRPVLTYSELAQLSAGQPSALFDPLNRILGLEALTAADKALRTAEAEIGRAGKDAATSRAAALGLLAESDDDRAAPLRAALTGRSPDTRAARELLEKVPKVEAGAVGSAAAWVALPLPDQHEATVVAAELSAALDSQQQEKEGQAGRAERLAQLLQLVLDDHRGPYDRCPVCGQGTLDEDWLRRAGEETARQAAAARTASEARTRRNAAAMAARRLVPAVPHVLSEPAVGGADPAKARAAWQALEECGRPDGDDAVLARDLPLLTAGLSTALSSLAEAAATVVAELDRVWQPVALQAADAVRLAETAAEAAPLLADLKTARTWLKGAAEEIRNDRLRPFADQATAIWAALRQESNVSLSGVTLTGQNTRREVHLELAVDGVPGTQAVLSQGELAALGLALFLPRSAAEESLFRFVIIDDPVQSLDPSKVDGLARVLHALAADRQVVVFTHDNRLPKSLRHLDLQFTHHELTRGERSVVTTSRVDDPVTQHLKDAIALAKDPVLPADLLALAVAGYCRDAVEDAAMEVARRRLLREGRTVEEVDAALDGAGTTRARLGLALLGDTRARRGPLNAALLQLGGTKDLLDRCIDAVHEPDASEDLPGLVVSTTRFVEALRASA